MPTFVLVKKLDLITGWAHGLDSLQPLAARLNPIFDVQILSASEVLAGREIPEADFIVGWSMGGMLAMERLPAACRKLILIASTARFAQTDGYECGTPAKTLRSFHTLLRRKPQAVLPEIAGNIYRPGPIPAFPPTDSSNLTVLADDLGYLIDTDLREAVPDINIPVLLLHGTEDSMIPSTASVWLHEHLPESQLELFPGEGHALALQNPDLIAEHIKAFFV